MVHRLIFVYLCQFRIKNMNFEEYTKMQWDTACGESSADEVVGNRIWKRMEWCLFRSKGVLGWTAVAVVAAACLAVLGVFIWPGRDSASSETAVHMIHYIAETNDCLDLPDGSHVWLDAGSSVSYPEDMTVSRVVSLTGNAVFDVTKKENGQNFIVELDGACVEVHGTSFSVNHGLGDIVYVTLYSGLVDFVAGATGQRVSLMPSNRLEFNPEESTISVAPFFKGISWKDGNYVIENASLGDIVEFICWNWSINVSTDPSIGNGQRVNGKIMHSETPGSVLDKLCFMLDLNYDKSGNDYLIHK